MSQIIDIFFYVNTRNFDTCVAFLEVRVRISQPEYSVNEGDGTVTVCVVRDGLTTDPITVTLNTREGSATGESVNTQHLSSCQIVSLFLQIA